MNFNIPFIFIIYIKYKKKNKSRHIACPGKTQGTYLSIKKIAKVGTLNIFWPLENEDGRKTQGTYLGIKKIAKVGTLNIFWPLESGDGRKTKGTYLGIKKINAR